ELAHTVVSTRGQTRPPVWTKSYTALAGLYLAENQPQVNSAFLSALGDGTIGDRIGKKEIAPINLREIFGSTTVPATANICAIPSRIRRRTSCRPNWSTARHRSTAI